jgi:HEPN domain-containing protein
VSRLAASFLRLSRRDLAGARRLLPDMPMLAAFLVQQAAEKLTKAELAAAGVTPPRPHDIGHLAGLLPPDHPRWPALAALDSLTTYAIAGRYPEGEDLASDLDPGELARRADEIEALLDDTALA